MELPLHSAQFGAVLVISPPDQKASGLTGVVKRQSEIANAEISVCKKNYLAGLQASNLEKTKEINMKLDNVVLFSPQLETFDFWQFDPSPNRDVGRRQMKKELEARNLLENRDSVAEGEAKTVQTVDKTREEAKVDTAAETKEEVKSVQAAGEVGAGAKYVDAADKTICSNKYEAPFKKEEAESKTKSTESKDETEASAAEKVMRPARKFEIYLNVRLFTLNEVTVTMLENNVLEVYATHALREAHGMRFTRSCTYLYEVPENLSKEDLFVGWTDDEILVIKQKSSSEKYPSLKIPQVRKERILKLNKDPRSIMYMHDESIDQLKYVFKKTKSEPPSRMSKVPTPYSSNDIPKEPIVKDLRPEGSEK